MGLSVGSQSFAPHGGDLRAPDGQTAEGAASPLDPLVEALGRAVERSAKGARPGDTREARD